MNGTQMSAVIKLAHMREFTSRDHDTKLGVPLDSIHTGKNTPSQ